MKTISFIVPCYNSASYMNKCIESLLEFGEDIEILIINDGSDRDNTADIAYEWQTKYPSIIRAIDQENKGHGGALNTGIQAAQGLYVKVVDSDDWLDAHAASELFSFLQQQKTEQKPCDLVIGNYVYEKVYEGKRQVMSYENVFPIDRVFTWENIGDFRISQYLLMHSIIYRLDLVKDSGLNLPEHCFYVDNIFAYVPLPQVESIRYFNVELYHYFIGREDQSVNEQVMLSRIDQQLTITKYMINACNLEEVKHKKLATYMYNYLSMMMCICSVFLRMEQTDSNEAKRFAIWHYLKDIHPEMYSKVRGNNLNFYTNFPSGLGRFIALQGYRLARKIFKFN